MKTEFRSVGTQLADRSSQSPVASKLALRTASRQVPAVFPRTHRELPVSPSLLVAPTPQNRLYLRFLRQAEYAAWQDAPPSTTLTAAPKPARRRSAAPLPRTPSRDGSESWVLRLLAVLALVPAAWVCWDSVDFFTRYPQFVQFVQNLVR